MVSTKERCAVFGLFKSSITAFLVIYAFLPVAASQDCYTHFQVDGNPSVGVGKNVYVTKSDISETLPTGDLLYTLTWDNGGSPGTPSNSQFTEYFEFDASEPNSWKVKVKKSLEGLPDFPDSTLQCSVQISHDLRDENTADPQFDAPSYSVAIREDYPIEFDIADLQIKVSDFDKDSPNNQFAVAVEGSQCPLKASQDTYTSVNGTQTLVTLRLTTELNYEEQQQLTCTLKAQDLGTPARTATAGLTVNVEDRPDEPPVFGYKFYYSILESSMNGEVLDVKPEAILAENVEGTGVTYSMENARSDVNGLEYFTIDSSSGAVSVKKDLEDSFLELERVSFILKAEATTGGSGADFSVLEVTLPPSHALDHLAATCPPCTTEAATCEPCTTSTPCPTLPTGESTVAATECPTCAPSTLSTWLSTLASTTSCPPCPTAATPGTTTTPHDTEPTYTSDATTCPPCPTTAMPGTTITPTTCPTTCPECPSTEGPTTCPECPSTETPTTCPECPTTCPSTETLQHARMPNTCPECPTTCPSTETPTACPDCPTTCPSTETPTTCPECPTTCPPQKPTACPDCPTTCPSTETPTTCPECPTTCPSTETPTTCPDCPTSCPECPTSCPSTETPTTCPSTNEPPGPTLTFKKVSYAGEIFPTTSRVWTVGVIEENADVTFSWARLGKVSLAERSEDQRPPSPAFDKGDYPATRGGPGCDRHFDPANAAKVQWARLRSKAGPSAFPFLPHHLRPFYLPLFFRFILYPSFLFPPPLTPIRRRSFRPPPQATGETGFSDDSVLDVLMPLPPDTGLHFEKFMYATEVLRPGQGDVVLRVHAAAPDGGQGEISYAFGKGGCVFR
ncbi:hypothetical protein C7M84_013426, partial [Penaeus vannamei]